MRVSTSSWDGAARLGGSGGFALANLGVEGATAGSISSGIEVISVATAQGLFAGGGLQGTKLWPGNEYNQALYGAGYNMAGITGGGHLAGAAGRGRAVPATVEAGALSRASRVSLRADPILPRQKLM